MGGLKYDSICFLKLLYSFLVCTIGLVIIVCSIVLYIGVTISGKEYELLLNNWNSDPLLNLAVVRSD